MQHEPSRLLSDTQSAMQFVAANTVLAGHDEPYGGKPFLQRNRGIFKHCADLKRELLLGMLSVAAVQACFLKVGNFLRAAVRAAHFAIKPANGNHELPAVVVIAEELDGFLKSLWRFHAPKVAESL